MQPNIFHSHDHKTCIKGGLAKADALCADRGLRMTSTRRRVLEILLAQHKAVGAYDILKVLEDEGLGSKPPTVYRALEFLVSNGFVHKIEILNAFVACLHHDNAHNPVFLVCRPCGAVMETEMPGHLTKAAAAQGFKIEHTVMEATGLCPECQANA